MDFEAAAEAPTLPLIRSPAPAPARSAQNSFWVLFFLVFTYIFLSYGLGSSPTGSRPLSRLSRPVVLLVSSDGFRFGYQFKTSTPNIHRLITGGTEAEEGLIPVFPTATFPNHYSIATGLYPAYHGIIYNYFVDPVSSDRFTVENHEPKWWLGEPIWETVTAQGYNAAVYFWPGSEVNKGSWACPPKFCPKYNWSVPFEERVDTVLGYFDLPDDEMPAFIALYFEDPDSQGHVVGPDHPQITDAVARIDRMIGRLISGLTKRGIFEDVTLILVGDHGMVGNCADKQIFLDDFSPEITIPDSWVQSYSPLLSIWPAANVSSRDVVTKMNQALNSGKIENGKYLKMFLKEDLPSRLHYSESYRIPPVIGLLAEGYKVSQKRNDICICNGAHGYDNAYFSMRTIFVAHGPQFERGRKIPSFENVEIYNLITSILKVKGAPNNGLRSARCNLDLGLKLECGVDLQIRLELLHQSVSMPTFLRYNFHAQHELPHTDTSSSVPG